MYPGYDVDCDYAYRQDASDNSDSDVAELNGDGLPIKDQYTTYDYTVADKRLQAVKETRPHYELLWEPDLPEFKSDSERRQYFMSDQGLKHKCYYNVTIDTPDYKETQEHITALENRVVAQFVSKSVKKWGAQSVLRVLAATETGSLFWSLRRLHPNMQGFIDQLPSPPPRQSRRIPKCDIFLLRPSV